MTIKEKLFPVEISSFFTKIGTATVQTRHKWNVEANRQERGPAIAGITNFGSEPQSPSNRYDVDSVPSGASLLFRFALQGSADEQNTPMRGKATQP